MNKHDDHPDGAQAFDPSATGVDNGRYFGFPYTVEEAEVVVYPVRWDVTTSYGGGAAQGPDAIREASPQLDFYDFDYPRAWETRIGTHPGNALCADNALWREKALEVIRGLERGEAVSAYAEQLERINGQCRLINRRTKADVAALLDEGKCVVLLGGDHASPLGLLEALAEREGKDGFGILHIDAHADLRSAYEGFTYSHASIMYNALQIPQVQRLVQVGVRDVCPDEMDLIGRSRGRVVLGGDTSRGRRLVRGSDWAGICRSILDSLPKKVYVSFDIDGLDPSLCPGTGTPVPGGLSFRQACYLLAELYRSGRHILGADLCEVSPSAQGEWDANVGARILYRLCCAVRATKKP